MAAQAKAIAVQSLPSPACYTGVQLMMVWTDDWSNFIKEQGLLGGQQRRSSTN